MKLSVKLPNMSLSRGQIPEDLAVENRGQRFIRTVRRFLGWGILGAVFFFIFAWLSIPTRALAWRISHEAQEQGFNVDIEDITVLPWGTLILHNVVWTFEPTRPQVQPAQYFLEEVDVRVGIWSILFGAMDVEVETLREEGRVWANYRRSAQESKLALKIEDLPLYDVPKAAPALGVPLFGIVGFDAELVLPEHRLSKAEGKIEISCSSCSAGDGESKLFVPGGKSLAKEGVTLPQVDMGTLTGRFLVEDGKARLDPPLETESEDLKVEVTGGLVLRDLVARTQFNMVLKVQLTDAFQQRSEAVRFMYQGASDKSRLDPPEEGLGFRLEGTLGRPRFLGIKSVTRADRTAQANNRRRSSAFQPASSARPTSPPSRPPRPGDDEEGAGGVGQARLPLGGNANAAIPGVVNREEEEPEPEPEDVPPAPDEPPPEPEPEPEPAVAEEEPVMEEPEVVADEPEGESPSEGEAPEGGDEEPQIEILDDGGEPQ